MVDTQLVYIISDINYLSYSTTRYEYTEHDPKWAQLHSRTNVSNMPVTMDKTTRGLNRKNFQSSIEYPVKFRRVVRTNEQAEGETVRI